MSTTFHFPIIETAFLHQRLTVIIDQAALVLQQSEQDSYRYYSMNGYIVRYVVAFLRKGSFL